MWLRLLHALGLTNLSDDDIDRIISSRPNGGELDKGFVFVVVQALLAIAVVAIVVRHKPPPELLAIDSVPKGAVFSVPESIVVRGTLPPSTAGTPILIIKPLVAGQPWYVQRTPKMIDDKTFELLVHFGDGATVGGTQFLLTVAVVNANTIPKEIVPETAVHQLPELPNARELLLVRR